MKLRDVILDEHGNYRTDVLGDIAAGAGAVSDRSRAENQWVVRASGNRRTEHETTVEAWERALTLFEDTAVEWVTIEDRAGAVAYRVTVVGEASE